ncbi:MAG: DUF2505 domain-containing protein [Austwickia sp.]|jgi:hypothetical protein|nr:DUF2505 domain-containing protein [Austwickia sp.]MBK8437815.1 DUF2505 domain-containing protein [Austwickia sp.]MBK9100122.1 DUF2505 domain-containing protein [Austwickia sp.]
MATLVRVSMDLPGPVNSVVALLRNEDFLRWRCAQNRELRESFVSLDAGGGLVRFASSARLPLTWVPERVHRYLPMSPQISREERWDVGGAAPAGTGGYDVVGLPARAQASMELRPLGADRSRIDYRIEVMVTAPLVGSTIERMVAQKVTTALRHELAGYGRYGLPAVPAGEDGRADPRR